MSKFHIKPNIFVTDIVLKVEDIKRTTEFYKKIMGFRVLKEMEKEVVFTVDGITPILTIIQPIDVSPKIQRRTGLYHFAILLPDSIQLGLFLKNIRSTRYPITGGSNHGVSEAVYLQDPDDNGIEVYADTSTDIWRGANNEITMVTEPLDYERLIAATGEKQWESAPIGTIIGHIHLHVSDLEEAKKFYVNGLDLDLIMEMQRSALFLSSGGYHHHIGLNVWNGKGAKPLPENSVGMKYFTLIFPDEKKRENTVNNLRELGYEVIEENNNIFTKDPSKNLIKLVI